MPITGISSASDIALPTSAGTHSSTTAKAPASCYVAVSSQYIAAALVIDEK
jgi:hypothetical protein